MALLEVIEQFQEVSSEQRHKLARLEVELREDNNSPIAQAVIQAVDRGEIETKKDLYDLMQSLKEYRSNDIDSLLSVSYEYSFEPPGDEFPLEYADALNKTRLISITPDGDFLEVDSDGNEIGPLDRDTHQPIEGHPEYRDISISIPDSPPIEVNAPSSFIPESLETLLESAMLTQPVSTPTVSNKQPVQSIPAKPLREVYLETDIGRLLFEPECAMWALRSLWSSILVEVSLRYSLEWVASLGYNMRTEKSQ
jgi:hypothetical protein